MIKNLPPETRNVLLTIYNNIWENQKYPEKWKEVITIPILKPNKNKTDPDSYRLISLSNSMSKILQKMVNKRLMWYIEKNNILNKNQSGFRNGRSTTDQIIQLDTEIQYAFQKKQHLIAVFFDIQKAYDMTWKHYILESLQQHGLNGNIMFYISNFLSNRKFQVKTNGCLSEKRTQENGVPQGEILSVTLFLLAMNKVTSFIPNNTKISLFADDIVIYTKGKNLSTIQRNLQRTISNMELWSASTGFKFSKTKTRAIHFCRLRKEHVKPVLKIEETPIKYENVAKFLGVTFDSKLNWETHIKNLKKECSQRLNLIKVIAHTKWGAQKESILNIYRALDKI